MPSEIKYQPRMNCELRHEPGAVCRATWSKRVRIKDHESQLGEFDVSYCSRCKLGLTDPFPTEETTGHLYEARDTSDFDLIQDSPIDHLKEVLSVRRLKQIAAGVSVRSVLDYATGNGRYALSAAKAFPGARIDAVDYQPSTPPLLAAQPDKVSYFEVTSFWAQTRRYDLIILRHVLEHTHHPVDLVRRLAEHLAPDGVLYIEVPNLDSGCAKIFGKNWIAYYVPRHIFHYTLASLGEIVRSAGLEPELGRNEVPWMGNTVAILTGASKTSSLVQLLGIALHPVQLAVEAASRSSTCINARCRHPAGSARNHRAP